MYDQIRNVFGKNIQFIEKQLKKNFFVKQKTIFFLI